MEWSVKQHDDHSSKRQKTEHRAPAAVAADEHIRKDPFDLDAWSVVIQEALGKPIAASRPLWERVVAQFPSAARCWRAYADAELEANNFDKCEEIFGRCLLRVPDVELFLCSMRYIFRVKRGAQDERSAIEAAFEFALRHVGADLNSGALWVDFVEFQKSREVRNQLETGQRMTAVRHAYQRGIQVAHSAVDRLWKDYDKFEHEQNKELAKELLAQYQQKFIAANMLYRERRRRREKVTGPAAASTGSSTGSNFGAAGAASSGRANSRWADDSRSLRSFTAFSRSR